MEGRVGRERNRDFLFHLFMHPWLFLPCAFTRDGACSRGLSGRCSNQLSRLASALILDSILVWTGNVFVPPISFIYFMSPTPLTCFDPRKWWHLNFLKKPKTKNFSQFTRALSQVWYWVVNKSTLSIVILPVLNTDKFWPLSPKKGQSYTLWLEPMCYDLGD